MNLFEILQHTIPFVTNSICSKIAFMPRTILAAICTVLTFPIRTEATATKECQQSSALYSQPEARVQKYEHMAYEYLITFLSCQEQQSLICALSRSIRVIFGTILSTSVALFAILKLRNLRRRRADLSENDSSNIHLFGTEVELLRNTAKGMQRQGIPWIESESHTRVSTSTMLSSKSTWH